MQSFAAQFKVTNLFEKSIEWNKVRSTKTSLSLVKVKDGFETGTVTIEEILSGLLVPVLLPFLLIAQQCFWISFQSRSIRLETGTTHIDRNDRGGGTSRWQRRSRWCEGMNVQHIISTFQQFRAEQERVLTKDRNRDGSSSMTYHNASYCFNCGCRLVGRWLNQKSDSSLHCRFPYANEPYNNLFAGFCDNRAVSLLWRLFELSVILPDDQRRIKRTNKSTILNAVEAGETYR